MIRLGEISDLAELLELARDYFARCPSMDHDPAELEAFIRYGLERGYVIVAEEGGAIVGSLALERTRPPWSKRYRLRGLWQHSLGRAWPELLEAAKAIATRLELELAIGDMTGERLAAKVRTVRRHGFKLIGYFASYGSARQVTGDAGADDGQDAAADHDHVEPGHGKTGHGSAESTAPGRGLQRA